MYNIICIYIYIYTHIKVCKGRGILQGETNRCKIILYHCLKTYTYIYIYIYIHTHTYIQVRKGKGLLQWLGRAKNTPELQGTLPNKTSKEP
jgi:hypothetical protein